MAVIILLIGYPASAWLMDRPVTPYGDFCPRCGNYGMCKFMMSPEEAEKAMMDYYNKKGFEVEVGKVKGRFIKARIKEKGRVVDTIIFDRRTGRIRSIY